MVTPSIALAIAFAAATEVRTDVGRVSQLGDTLSVTQVIRDGQLRVTLYASDEFAVETVYMDLHPRQIRKLQGYLDKALKPNGGSKQPPKYNVVRFDQTADGVQAWVTNEDSLETIVLSISPQKLRELVKIASQSTSADGAPDQDP